MLFDLVRTGLVFASIGASFSLTFRLGFLNLAHGDLIVFGGVLVASVYPACGGSSVELSWLPFLAAAGLAALGGGVVSLLIHKFVLEPPLRRSLRMPQVLSGLGASLVLAGVLGLAFGVRRHSLPVPQTVLAVSGSFVRKTDLLLVSPLAAMLVLERVFRRRSWALSYAAASSNRRLAALWGIRVGPISWIAAWIGGAWAALLGTEAVFAGQVTPGTGLSTLILAFAGIVVGARYGLWGMVCGAGLVGFCHHLAGLLLAPWAATMVVLALVSITLLVAYRRTGFR